MRKLFFWATIVCGATAAYLMFKRGVPVEEIADDIMQHPVKTLVHELGNA